MSINVEEVLVQLRQQPARIVLVDDEHIVTSSIETYLMLESPHDVHSFNRPKEALKAMATLRPDVVISDFNMPEMTGIEFLKQVKQRHPQAETILLTGYADKENAIAAINEVGIYRYLEKPWDNAQLHTTIEQALERQRLVRGLENTLSKVSKLNQTLKQYNQVLEQKVQERTQALAQANATLEAMIQHSADGIVLSSATGEILRYNSQFASWVHGLREEAALALGDRLHDWLPALNQQAPQLPEEEHPHYQQLRLRHSGKPLEALGSQLPGLAGETLWVFRDTSHRQKVDDLRHDFVATLTHDLRTPLQAALQFFEFFRQGRFGAPTATQLDMLKVMKESHEDLLKLVNTLLDVYRYEAGKQPLVFQEMDTLKQVAQVTEALSPFAQEQGHTLEVAPCALPKGHSLQGDALEFKRVLHNLIGNAIKHTPAGTHIKVALKLMEPHMKSWQGFGTEDLQRVPETWRGWFCVYVQDDGPGISPADQAQLFQRFSSGTSRKRNSGSGLGLYLAQQIMRRHGGCITLESTEGKGSCFQVWLPYFSQPAVQTV